MSGAAVLGAGAWGTAFALLLADAGHPVRLWARRADVVAEVNEHHTNSSRLPGVELPAAVTATTDVEEALAGADLVVLAVPLQATRAQLSAWPGLPDVPVVVLAKGLERGSGLLAPEVVREAGHVGADRLVVVSGPNLAAEIGRRRPAAAVVACADDAVAGAVADSCRTPAFRTYDSTDVTGVAVAGALKNVVALAVGVTEGAGFGANAEAAVLTRGLAESARFGQALGADAGTFVGLAGVGDLVATCGSPLSRNHRVGLALGRGMSTAEAVASVEGTAEGVATASAILQRAEAVGVEMPLTREVVAVLDGVRTPAAAAERLLARPRRADGL